MEKDEYGWDDPEDSEVATLRAYKFRVEAEAIAYGRTEAEARGNINIQDENNLMGEHPTGYPVDPYCFAISYGYGVFRGKIIGKGKRIPEVDLDVDLD